MNNKQFLELGKQLGLVRENAHPGLCLYGMLDGVPVFVAQYEMAVDRDPRPRPFTELRVEKASMWRGGLCAASFGYRGDTGDHPFDEKFYWSPQLDPPSISRPHYLGISELRRALIDLDASIASAIGHKGMAVFQIDHLEAATRMMILTHLPQPSLLERALRLLILLSGP
jgi:hypothetical protein